jgi:AcrR family transcriptional regulator
MTAVTRSLAERKRQLVRDELTESALRLLAFQGYEQTTVDQIVTAAGVSRRTFFRYFRSKEDVIIEFLSDLGDKLRGALAARPAAEPPMVALHRALDVFTETYAEHEEKSLRLATITLTTPALLARYLERQAQWRAEATAVLVERAGADADELTAALVAAVGFGAFDVALTAWVRANGAARLPDLIGDAFDRLPATVS